MRFPKNSPNGVLHRINSMDSLVGRQLILYLISGINSEGDYASGY